MRLGTIGGLARLRSLRGACLGLGLGLVLGLWLPGCASDAQPQVTPPTAAAAVVPSLEEILPLTRAMGRAPASAPRAAAATAAIPEPVADAERQRQRQIFYATNRAPKSTPVSNDMLELERSGMFGDELRADGTTAGHGLSFGSLVIQAPSCRRVGEVPRPTEIGVWHWTFYREATDPRRHFTIRRAQAYATEAEFGRALKAFGSRSALLFVHGFRNTFLDAAFHLGQIVYDMDYAGVPVLFSWPAGNAVFDYWHDQGNAAASRAAFLHVLNTLQRVDGIDEVHVIAHSMGNHVVLDALRGASGLRPLGELIMAAPDVDREHYRDMAAHIRAVTKGMTLYASGRDRAMLASRVANGGAGPRAGDVPAGGPAVVPGAEAVDLTALGDLFGLNHSGFSVSPTLIADMKQLVLDHVHPPGRRPGPFQQVALAAPADAVYWRHDPPPADGRQACSGAP